MGEDLTVLRVGNVGAGSGAETVDVADLPGALTTLAERSVDGVLLPAERAGTGVDLLREHHPSLPIVLVGEQAGAPSQREGRALRGATAEEALATLETVLAERDAETALREHRDLRRAVGRIAADTATATDARASTESALERLLGTDRFGFGFGAERRDDGSVLELPGTGTVEFQVADDDGALDSALAATETVVLEDGEPPAIVVPAGGDRGLVLFTDDGSAPGPGEREVLDDLAALLQGPHAAGTRGGTTGEAPQSDEAPPETPAAAEGPASGHPSDVLVEMLAHELRSPLDLGRGHLEMAVEDGEEEDIERAIETFDRIDDVVSAGVSLARLETDAERSVDLAEVAQSVWSETATAEASLAVEEPAALGSIEADPALLERLLSNLFRNAIEHGGEATEGGEGVTVRVGPLEDGGFYVADDGAGIDPADRDRILEPGVSLGDEGTGYGLAIVDRVAAAHDWDLAVGEAAEGGARFEVRTG